MNSTMTSTDLRKSASELADDASQGAKRVRDTATGEFSKLVADVEDLIKKLVHVSDADIAKVRDRVEKTLASTRTSIEQGAERVKVSGRQAAEATDTYVHERPWTSLGIAAAVGVVLGVLSARR